MQFAKIILCRNPTFIFIRIIWVVAFHDPAPFIFGYCSVQHRSAIRCPVGLVHDNVAFFDAIIRLLRRRDNNNVIVVLYGRAH